MIKWFPILSKFPKWAIAGGLILASSAVFVGWLAFFRPSGNSSSGSDVKTADRATVNPDGFKPDEVVLCGNSLVDFTTGKVLTHEWLQGLNGSAPPIVQVLPAEKLVICGNRGQATAFSFDGTAKPPVKLDGKPIGAAGYSFGDSKVAFVRDGNLWLGRVDWPASVVNDAKRLTDVGYFRDDTFRGDWFWNDQILYVPVLGRSHRVSLDTGAVTQVTANIGQLSQGASPDGKLSVVALGLGNFAVLNFATGEAKQFSVQGRFKEFCWLGAGRLAFVSGRTEISIYDSTTGKTSGPFQCLAIPTKLVAPSPTGKCLIIAIQKGAVIFDSQSGKFTAVELPIEDGVWISDDALLCTNASTDTSLRGIWRVAVDGKQELVSNQPSDSVRAASGGSPMISVQGGAVFVSGKNLWHYDSASGAVKQLTQDGNLAPSLQLLSRSRS